MVGAMRILHTADWHLGDRLGRIDRTDDLRRAVERVADYCKSEQVEVLLVAGDLFSELSRPDSLRESIAHLQATFEPNYRPQEEEFRILKAAATLAAFILQFEDVAPDQSSLDLIVPAAAGAVSAW